MGKETKEARAERQAKEAWTMIQALRAAGNFVEEEVLVPNLEDSKWRVDYLVSDTVGVSAAHPHLARPRFFALEVQGFGFSHCGRTGWHRDIYKAQAIAANGWLYMPVTWEQVKNGDALEMFARAGVRVEAK